MTYTRKIKRKDFLAEGQYPVVSQEDQFINGFWDDDADLFRVTTPVVVFGDHTKVLKYVDFDFVLGADGVKVLRPRDFLLPRFFYYQLQTLDLESLGYARHYRLLRELEIVFPDEPAQQRIVGILDDALGAIAVAKANAEKNLESACALFESCLHAVFSQRDEGWTRTRLAACVDSISTGPFGSVLHKSDYQHGGMPLVNPINIWGDLIVSDDRKAVGQATADRLSAYALREGDIVIGRRGEMGRCAVVTNEQRGWLCGTGCFVIRPSATVDPHFLSHLLRSRPYREKLEGVANRATMPSISNKDLANLEVELPPLAEQRQILVVVRELSAGRQSLESIYQRKLTALEELRKSLLREAFSGRLTKNVA